MSTEDANGDVPMAERAAGGLRDRLVAALLAQDGDLVLVHHDAAMSELVKASGPPRIVVITAGEGDSAEPLRAAVTRLVRAGGSGGTEIHFVVVGGGPEAHDALRGAAPRIQPVPMGFHHVGPQGRLERAAGRALPLLERAVEGLPVAPPPTPERFAEALSAGRALVEREHAVAVRLTGRHAVTAALTVACAALFGLSYLWGRGAFDAALLRMGANSGEAVRDGEVYRLLASAFLHADIIHLAVNMLALWSFGPLLEALLGPRRYLLLYGASALGGSLASAMVGGRLSVGASGAIWGLMAAGIGIALRPRGLLPPLIISRMRSRVWMPLVLNLAYSFRPGVDMLAHLGGGAVGFALAAGVLTNGLRPVEQRADAADAEPAPTPAVTVAAAIMGAAMAASVIAALVAGRPWTLAEPPTLVRTRIADTGVTLDLPSALTDTVKVDERAGLRLVQYGKFPEGPIVLEVLVAVLPGEPTPEELDAFLEEERKAVEQGPPEAARKGAAQRVTVGGRPAVRVEHTMNGVQLMTYVMVIGTREVLVRSYAPPQRPEAWAGIEEKIVASAATE